MIITILLAIFLAWPIKFAQAVQVLPVCTATGNCQLCDFVLGFMNILRWGFGVVGTVALLFIIIAGIQWILSQGSPDKVKKAKNKIVAIVIGLAIMLLSWQITNFLVATFTLSNNPNVKASEQNQPSLFSFNNNDIWYNACSSAANPCVGRGDGAPCAGGTGYCLADKITKKISCHADKGSTCNFLSSDPDFAKYYKNYSCQSATACDFNRDLGPGYCGDQTNNCCVKSLDSTN